MLKKLLLAFILLILIGCSTYMEQVVYKPAPATYEEWSKSGTSILDIKKALLECGKPASDTNFEIYEKVFNISRYDELAYMNRLQFEDICLERAGYKYNGIYDTKKICSLEKYKNLSACQPNTIIPTPSVERRLNSWYCKVKSDYDYCLKYSLNPTACSPEDARHLPPECLPVGQAASQIDTTIQNERKSSIYVAPSRAQQQATDLQRETQSQNNRQMNNMLKSTTLKTR